MRNFLINLSRKRRVTVPVVTLMALSIGISGYYIQNEKILREQKQAEVQSQDVKFEEEKLQSKTKLEKEQKSPTNNEEEAPPVDSTPKQDAPVGVQHAVSVTASKLEDKKVSVASKIDTKKPGTCVVSMKQGGFGPEEQVETVGGSCEALFENPGPGSWDVAVLFTSSDGSARGSGSTSIKL